MSETKFTPGPWYVNGSFVYAECEAEAQRAAVRADRNCGATVSPLANIIGRNNDAHVANARLIAAAPDHADIGWAMCVGAAQWEAWGDGRGEFCMNGLRHATKLDPFGIPEVTPAMRETIRKARGETA